MCMIWKLIAILDGIVVLRFVNNRKGTALD